LSTTTNNTRAWYMDCCCFYDLNYMI